MISRDQRFLLAHFYEVRALIDVERSSEMGRIAEALREGFEGYYQFKIDEGFEEFVLSSGDCDRVRNWLSLYEAIGTSLKGVPQEEIKKFLRPALLRYQGVKGNSYAERMDAFARFIREEMEDANIMWGTSPDTLSSPEYLLDECYGRWCRMGQPDDMNLEDIKQLLLPIIEYHSPEVEDEDSVP